jgi:anti-sigma B factor antagonist
MTKVWFASTNPFRFWHLPPTGFQSVAKMPMKLEVRRIDRDAVIRLAGRLDINTSPDLRKAALTVCGRGRCSKLTIDFTNVSFIDTSGLATLLDIAAAAHDQSMRLTLSGVDGKVRYLLDVNGLTGFFTIENSEREKLRA